MLYIPVNSDLLAPFELALRYRSRPLYIYEFKFGHRVFYSVSVDGQMLSILEPVRLQAINKAKEYLDMIEGEKDKGTSQDKREVRSRYRYERGQGY